MLTLGALVRFMCLVRLASAVRPHTDVNSALTDGVDQLMKEETEKFVKELFGRKRTGTTPNDLDDLRSNPQGSTSKPDGLKPKYRAHAFHSGQPNADDRVRQAIHDLTTMLVPGNGMHDATFSNDAFVLENPDKNKAKMWTAVKQKDWDRNDLHTLPKSPAGTIVGDDGAYGGDRDMAYASFINDVKPSVVDVYDIGTTHILGVPLPKAEQYPVALVGYSHPDGPGGGYYLGFTGTKNLHGIVVRSVEVPMAAHRSLIDDGVDRPIFVTED